MTTTTAVATIYIASIGASLYCGPTVTSSTEPWIALPPDNTWECGDLYHLSFKDGTSLMARALDSGAFANHCVQTSTGCYPIAVDIPQQFAPFPGLSVGLVRLTNITARARGVERDAR